MSETNVFQGARNVIMNGATLYAAGTVRELVAYGS